MCSSDLLKVTAITAKETVELVVAAMVINVNDVDLFSVFCHFIYHIFFHQEFAAKAYSTLPCLLYGYKLHTSKRRAVLKALQTIVCKAYDKSYITEIIRICESHLEDELLSSLACNILYNIQLVAAPQDISSSVFQNEKYVAYVERNGKYYFDDNHQIGRAHV